MEDCWIFKETENNALEQFKNIILVSSPQDNYSPYESSRIQISDKLRKEKNAPNYIKMAENILNKVKTKKITRVDIDMYFTESNLDSMIGRAAHICQIDNLQVIQMLIYRYGHMFN